MREINGELEADQVALDGIKIISIVWSDRYDSHAFMLDQILTELEAAGYASRDEMAREWKTILEIALDDKSKV